MILSNVKVFLSVVLFVFFFKEITCNKKFPPNFLFGTATAAYQIEGGWNLDGKGPSIWDTYTHEHPDLIKDHSNADIGPDSYHKFNEDLKAMKEIGLQFYRFSISWSRLLSNGDVSSLNQHGIDYYNMIINKLVENNIKPMVTMFHYDLPQQLQDLGGFMNPLLLKYFEKYAEVLYENFGDRVKFWITFNEPFDYCIPGYGTATYPPLINLQGIADYLCMDHTIKAHALAYRLYEKKYLPKFRGKIGITISSRFFFSKENDQNMVDRGMQFMLGWLAHPIYSKAGGYPPIMIEEIARNSLHEKRQWSRLPTMSDEWINIVRGAGDFIGLNYYTSRYVKLANSTFGNSPSWERDSRLDTFVDPKWTRAKSDWLFSVPEGLEGILKYIRDEYDNTEVIITENGWSDDGQLDDHDRITYLHDHIQAILNAINDGCKVTAYAVWSLIDNFEWNLGYTEKFGLYAVNFSSPNRERTPKQSSYFYKKIIETRLLT